MAQTDIDRALQPVRNAVHFTHMGQRACARCGKTCLHEKGYDAHGNVVFVCLSCDTMTVVYADNTTKWWKGG